MIVENQIPSVIDNIFSNNTCNEITAGNIFIMFSEHLSQFQLKKRNLTIKNKTYIFMITLNIHQKVLKRTFPYKASTIDMIQLMMNLMIFSGD